jgi:predicted ATPase
LKENIFQYTPIDDIKIEDNFTLIKNKDTFSINSLLFQFKINNDWFTWNQLSDGTKRIIQIIFEISKEGYNDFAKIVFLEEPELGIHPDQLHKLMDFLIEQSKEKQIIITTHSPEVLNAVHPDELDRIIVTRYDDEKGTLMHKLNTEQAQEMGARIKQGDMFLSDRWVHLNLEDEIFNATKLDEN